ncbi:MAG: hypothetical protein FD155_3438 [Bacteroidetes bacterium]|nr:MAG: hypothetical protein FD155_3438 [Bacteroidota bacterium]
MPAASILTSAKISYVGLSLFFKQLDMSCLENGGGEGDSEIPDVWRIHNRYRSA